LEYQLDLSLDLLMEASARQRRRQEPCKSRARLFEEHFELKLWK